MFSDKTNVNILTSLLVAHGVRHVVVCPGSRNAPLAHNFFEHPLLECIPVTDERSAGFYALGLAQATRNVVAVCVTSGSALLNVAPAVAEAAYQHLPMVVISADRPPEWIGQLDGQTIRQPGALATLVAKTVDLPVRIGNGSEQWHCNRLVNEALLAAKYPQGAPVHINVPIEEPLFGFNTPQLPEERVVKVHRASGAANACMVARWLLEAERPMIVVGQYGNGGWLEANGCPKETLKKALKDVAANAVVLAERLCLLPMVPERTEEALAMIGGDEEYMPTMIIYAGGTLVSKRLKHFMRKSRPARVVMTGYGPQLNDVTTHLTDMVEMCSLEDIVMAASAMLETGKDVLTHESVERPADKQKEYHDKWQRVMNFAEHFNDDFDPPFSQMAAVKYLEQQLDDMEYDFQTHYANSTAIRLANIYASHPVYCNRGTNGIEGSLSTAAGFSLASGDMVFCVIGDLSFFYDQNALWNSSLRGNLRILLLNNGGGAIFRQLQGLENSGARDSVVAAAHNTMAQGICTQNDIGYIKAQNMESMKMGMLRMLTTTTQRPMVLEVVTNADDDATTMQQYFKQLIELWQRENGKR